SSPLRATRSSRRRCTRTCSAATARSPASRTWAASSSGTAARASTAARCCATSPRTAAIARSMKAASSACSSTSRRGARRNGSPCTGATRAGAVSTSTPSARISRRAPRTCASGASNGANDARRSGRLAATDEVVLVDLVPPFALRAQVLAVGRRHPGHVLDRRDVADAEIEEVVDLLRVVREQAERAVAQEEPDQRGGVAEIARIVRQAERAIRLVGVLAGVLQHVGRGLRPQADAAPLVPGHVDQHAAFGLRGDALERREELRPAFAAGGAEHVAREAAR